MRQNRNAFYPRRNPDAGVREDRRKFLESASVSLGLPSLFYASLRDSRVFETVTGRPLQSAQWELATLGGYRLAEANAGTGYPGIFAAETGTPLDCVLVHDLSRFEQTMVAWYEWDEYVLETMFLADGRPAQVFVPDLEAVRREYGPFQIKPWSFEQWRAEHLDRAVANARAWMAERPGDEEMLEAGCFADSERPADRRATG